jgi:hypothetical protein
MLMPDATGLQENQSLKTPFPQSILYLILALALIRGLIYASVMPPWQAPDEPAHFERAKAALSTEEWLNTSADGPAWYTELRDSLLTFEFLSYTLGRVQNSTEATLNSYFDLYHGLYGGLYGNRLTYAVMGFPLFLAPNQDIVLQLYLVRLNTILMAIAIIFLAYRITQTIFPDDHFLIWGVSLLILFNPQHTHMLSTVNNGNLAELLATATLYGITWGLRRGFSVLNVLATLGLALAAMWTKPTAYFLIIPLACLGGLFLWRYRRQWPWLLLTTIILAGLAYFLAPARLTDLLTRAWASLIQGELALNPIVMPDIFRSFWAMPGWAILRLPSVWYQILSGFCLLALSGLIKWVLTQGPTLKLKQFQSQGQTLLIFGLAVGTAIGIQVGWHILTGSLLYRQGRSLYPVIVPIAIFLMLGWQQLLPLAWRKTGLLGLTLVFFLFDSLVLFSYIIPFFYSRY